MTKEGKGRVPVRKEKVDTRLVKNAESLAPIYELTHKPEVFLCKEQRKKVRGSARHTLDLALQLRVAL